MKSLRIGVAGLGNVGSGLFNLLLKEKSIIEERCGRQIEILMVSARNKEKLRDFDFSKVKWVDDPLTMAECPDIDVVCELIGGESGVALDLTRAALSSGKHLVTANKAMLAIHGDKLSNLAEEKGVQLCFEAAVAGGIPIIKSMREGFAGNSILGVFGILNGTCNFILTRMYNSISNGNPIEFNDVLREAQQLGYAESEPSADIDGADSAHKICLLSSLAFGMKPDFESIHIEGIRHISALDIAYAAELGYRVKLLAIARQTLAGIENRVHPCMISEESTIARVDGVNNAVVINGSFVGNSIFEGPGAGGNATASAVVSDLIDIARGQYTHTFGIPVHNLKRKNIVSMDDIVGPYYIRLMLVDKPGVIADISACLRDQNVSVESMIQRARNPGDAVPVVLTTHDAKEGAVRIALKAVSKLSAVVEEPCMIRIEKI
ncbi:MAG: homoserine dehydrogenase [Rhodospirillaceae bacterium]|nr:homoserine dehydrogenase [Rhodospirillaceae bacterium]